MSQTLETLKQIRAYVTENFTPRLNDKIVFDPTNYQPTNIRMPAWFDSRSVFENSSIAGNHNFEETIKAIPTPDHNQDLKLIRFPIGELGIIYHYGISGLIYICEMLAKYNMDFCSQPTGPLLAQLNSELITSSETLILTLPIFSRDDQKEGLLLSCKRGKKNLLEFDAYQTGGLYPDTFVIAQVL